jgi:hypothetical protein
MKVAAIASPFDVASVMWFPVKTRSLQLADGNQIDPMGASRLLVLWLNSTRGLLVLLAEREETRGAWVEWKTERMRNMKVFDIRKLVTWMRISLNV